MDSGVVLWLLAVSAAASALGGMLGMASGIFIVPILTIFGHIEIHTAIGASRRQLALEKVSNLRFLSGSYAAGQNLFSSRLYRMRERCI